MSEGLPRPAEGERLRQPGEHPDRLVDRVRQQDDGAAEAEQRAGPYRGRQFPVAQADLGQPGRLRGAERLPGEVGPDPVDGPGHRGGQRGRRRARPRPGRPRTTSGGPIRACDQRPVGQVEPVPQHRQRGARLERMVAGVAAHLVGEATSQLSPVARVGVPVAEHRTGRHGQAHPLQLGRAGPGPGVAARPARRAGRPCRPAPPPGSPPRRDGATAAVRRPARSPHRPPVRRPGSRNSARSPSRSGSGRASRSRAVSAPSGRTRTSTAGRADVQQRGWRAARATGSPSSRTSTRSVGWNRPGVSSASPRRTWSRAIPRRFTATRATAATRSRGSPSACSPRIRTRRPVTPSSSSSPVRSSPRAEGAGDHGAAAAHGERAVHPEPDRRGRRSAPASGRRAGPARSAARPDPAPVTALTADRLDRAERGRRDPRGRLLDRRAGVGQVGAGDREQPVPDVEGVQRGQVLGGLRHPALVGGDHDQRGRHRADAGEHVGDEPLMPGYVDERDRPHRTAGWSRRTRGRSSCPGGVPPPSGRAPSRSAPGPGSTCRGPRVRRWR